MSAPERAPGPARRLWARLRAGRWTRLGLELLVVALAFTAVAAWQTRHLPTGRPAPDFTLRTPDGAPVRLSDLRGKPVLLSFWAPWCGVCKAESATLSAVREWVGGSAHVLSVAVAYEDEADVHRFMREQAVDYPVLLGGPDVTRDYAVHMFPTTFFVTPEGQLARATVGYTTRLGLLWRLFW